MNVAVNDRSTAACLESLSPRAAIALQEELRARVVTTDSLPVIQRVAGLDVGFEEQGTVVRGAIAVLSYPALELLETAVARRPTRFPYIPGLLSFREIPALLDALQKLTTATDLLLCDGQGIAHPRRLGIASHLGLLTGIPAIGVAKSRLCGTYAEVPTQRGAWTPLYDGETVIGAVLRTRTGVKPVFVSVGHRISLATAVGYVMACTTRYRLPETTRHAHRLASRERVVSNPA